MPIFRAYNFQKFPCSPVDNIWAVVNLWRIRSRNCSVLYCVPQLYTVMSMSSFWFLCVLKCFSYFDLCLFICCRVSFLHFGVLSFDVEMLPQKMCLWNDICVEWDICCREHLSSNRTYKTSRHCGHYTMGIKLLPVMEANVVVCVQQVSFFNSCLSDE